MGSDDEVSFTGGSRIGWVNASWPFARLSCSRERLVLSSLGRYEFTPGQVVAFGTFGSIPLLANGLRIHHNRADYPERVVFWCMGSRQAVLAAVEGTGFAPAGQGEVVPRKGFPIRWSALVAFVVIWNVLFLADVDLCRGAIHARSLPGWGVVSMMAFGFVAASATKWWPGVQRAVLAPGREVGEIRGLLTLVQLATGVLAVAFTAAMAFGGS